MEKSDRRIGFVGLRAIEKIKECIFGKSNLPNSFSEYGYFIGTFYKEDLGVYIYYLMRQKGKINPEVVFAKPIINQDEFKEEVGNISKYFNATVIEL